MDCIETGPQLVGEEANCSFYWIMGDEKFVVAWR